MLSHNEEPKDWEVRDEEPPEHLQKKWEQEETMDSKSVICPACKKETPAENLACVFCGGTILVSQPGAAKTPWYAKTATLVIGFLTVGPFALPLVWLHPGYSRRKKVIVTAIVLALTYVLVAAFLHAVKTIFHYYAQAGIF